MNEMFIFKKKNYIYFVNAKSFNNYLTNNFNLIREKKLTPLTNRVERKFV